jgi:hypothetical protein
LIQGEGVGIFALGEEPSRDPTWKKQCGRPCRILTDPTLLADAPLNAIGGGSISAKVDTIHASDVTYEGISKEGMI